MSVAIKTENLSKKYDSFFANKDISMEIETNSVHAIVGENGAGKSTFVNMLYGITKKNYGKIFVFGQEVDYKGSKDAIDIGVGMVSQHFRLIPEFTVTENIILGMEPGKKTYLNRAAASKAIYKLTEEYGLMVNPDAKVKDISIGEQQRVEILKVLYRGSKVLILDEPTAVLTPQEIRELGVVIHKLKKMGKTIIIITHKLQEVMDFTDNITVFRQGKKIGDLVTKETTPEIITEMMVGRAVQLGGKSERTLSKSNQSALTIKDLNFVSKQGKRIHDINLDVKYGEIVGIAGVDGSGQSELINLISGIYKGHTGDMSINGKSVEGMSIRERRDNSFGYIPEDRHKEGLILNFSIEDNLLLGMEDKKMFRNKYGLLHKRAIKKNALDKIHDYDIRTTSESKPCSMLSGGNQQKVVFAREVADHPDFVLVAQPTRGLDIGAIEFVHEKLVHIRDQNKGILVISFELDELIALCDRIIVMCAGKITGELERHAFVKEKIGRMMIGQVEENDEKE
ncbi:ABC transporter ATP-binding protein [Vallitalea pronyensis]|uniref:ABC transporter ATP-binding protein n=1 Tax=Vallitalea pronyensis TaxID=1348613 RepID=A0A8J8SGA3_9FIRM|nr:ABC transporter ATP-binding protein [Vallitalea pronyensis]QUI22093.1 ABC transporter ATP-binding protein [Vallitalea pronyensis]